MLIIDAEKDELMDIRQNGGQVAQILKDRGVSVQYHIIREITHYGVYREAFAEATKLEIDWFNEHLKGQATPKGTDAKR